MIPMHVGDRDRDRRQPVGHIAVWTDLPCLYPIAVANRRIRGPIELLPRPAPVLDELLFRWLKLILLVETARLQDGFLAVPVPLVVELRKRLRQRLVGELRLDPGL